MVDKIFINFEIITLIKWLIDIISLFVFFSRKALNVQAKYLCNNALVVQNYTMIQNK